MTGLPDQLQASLGAAFMIEREVAGGGMSRVFVATEVALGRRVAIKVLSPELASAVSAERFRREIQLVARLQHPHIVPVHTTGEAGGLLFYTMPFVEGESLRARLQRDGKLPVSASVALLTELAGALAYAHERGVVHRDIKPENVLLSGAHAMLADFGIAKAVSAGAAAGALTSVGMVLGTPAYMAPEQIAGDAAIDARADIYSLGLVAYEMLAGSTPFADTSPQAMLAAHLAVTPRSLSAYRAEAPERLVAIVMQCLEKDPARRPQTAAEIAVALQALGTATAAGTVSRTRLPVILGAGGAIVVAVLLALVLAPLLRSRAATPLPSAAAPIQAVAVLPVENAAGDSTAYFTEGITDELGSALAKVPGLRVAPRTSVLYFKGRNLNIRQIGESLHVAAVLEGRVRRDASTVRVNAQLTSTRDGLSLWSDQFERERAGVFAMQDEITRAIVNALRLTVGATSAASRGASNPAAHDLYLKGRYFWEQRTRAGLTAASTYFGQALRLDSSYARAYAGLGDAWAMLGTFSLLPPSETYPKAVVAAQRAIQLDPALAEPHSTLGQLAVFYEWDWVKADREFDRAVALDSTYATAYLFRAWLKMFTGHSTEALASMRHARELEPLSKLLNARVGTMLFHMGRYSEAVDELRAALALDPAYVWTRLELSNALTMLGRYSEALEYAASDANALREGLAGELAYLYGRVGRRVDAAKLVAAMREEGARGYTSGYQLALAYVSAGDLDASAGELERDAAAHDNGVLRAGVDPRFAPIWSHPRFLALRRVMHLEGVPPGAARP